MGIKPLTCKKQVLTIVESNYKSKANNAFNNMRDVANDVYNGIGVIIGIKRILLE